MSRGYAEVIGASSGKVPVLQEVSVTPGASQMSVVPSAGYDGLSKVTVAGDSDLKAANIKSGVDIFGVTGTYTGTLKHATGTFKLSTSNDATNEHTFTGMDFKPLVLVYSTTSTSAAAQFLPIYGYGEK